MKHTQILALAFALALSACGDDDAPLDTGPVVDDAGTADSGPIGDAGPTDDAAVASSCLTMDPVVEIVDNHLPSGGDHQLTIPVADVLAGAEMTYDIRGDNTGHTHEITVTAADFTSLQEGTSVSIVSTNNGAAGMSHMHTITLSCP